MQHALAHLGDADAKELAGLLGHRDASDQDVARARCLIEASGAREHVESRIRSLREQSIAALQTDVLRPEGRDLLASFAALMTERRV